MNFVILARPKTGTTFLGRVLDCVTKGQFKKIDMDYKDFKRVYINKKHIIYLFAHPAIPADKIGKFDKKIVFTRDVRDMLVSYYFHLKYRRDISRRTLQEIPEGMTIDEFCLRSLNEAIDNFYIKYDSCYDLLVRYEDLYSGGVQKLIDYLPIDCDRDKVSDCILLNNFDNMRNIELEGNDNGELRKADSNNKESFKVRRGKVGGFVDYLSQDTIEKINKVIKDRQKETSVPITYK